MASYTHRPLFDLLCVVVDACGEGSSSEGSAGGCALAGYSAKTFHSLVAALGVLELARGRDMGLVRLSQLACGGLGHWRPTASVASLAATLCMPPALESGSSGEAYEKRRKWKRGYGGVAASPAAATDPGASAAEGEGPSAKQLSALCALLNVCHGIGSQFGSVWIVVADALEQVSKALVAGGGGSGGDGGDGGVFVFAALAPPPPPPLLTALLPPPWEQEGQQQQQQQPSHLSSQPLGLSCTRYSYEMSWETSAGGSEALCAPPTDAAAFSAALSLLCAASLHLPSRALNDFVQALSEVTMGTFADAASAEMAANEERDAFFAAPQQQAALPATPFPARGSTNSLTLSVRGGGGGGGGGGSVSGFAGGRCGGARLG
jgi:hypothetical protein